MKVSICKNIFSKTPEKNSSIFNVLESIKSGVYKSKISKLRTEEDSEKQKKLKNGLPFATFCGVFDYVSKTGFKKPSGLACLDFDDVPNVKELSEQINKDEYTFSSFVSPRGNGLKVLVKIPPVDNDDDYKDYYYELQKHFNKYHKTDDSTKDISRATFLSFDSNLFINHDSTLFTERFIRPIKKIEEPTNIPLTDQNEIAERLEKWNKKRYNGTNRNTTLHAYARQMNAFGVDQMTCEQYLFRYSEPDFQEREILTLINSAYKQTAEFGTQAFEDVKQVKKIKNYVLAGRTVESFEGFEDVEKDDLIKEVDKHKANLKEDVFWSVSEKGAMRIEPNLFRNYLQYNHISKYYPSDKGYVFIKKDGNFINHFNENRIKDFVLEDLDSRAEIEAWNMCAKNLITFAPAFLSSISTSQLDIQKDTKEEAYIYYNNTAIEVTKDSFNLIPYNNLKGLVWKDQVIDRELVLAPESDGEFQKFIWLISGQNQERYYTMKSVLGYLLHSYQNEGKPKVIIFNDEMISDAPNGGSGKGLLHKAIGLIKKLSTINGKGFDPNKSFAYQTVDTDSQVLLFDDIDKHFKFENLFSVITEGLEIEKKNQGTIKIPFSDSPKISITTNYTVKGEGGSHKRRVFEIEMSSHFNAEHTPEDEFGHLLFSEWTKSEWEKFDNYMLRCVQYFLKNGLVECDLINLELRKLRNETKPEFLDFMEEQDFTIERRFYKTELKDLFIQDNENFKYDKFFNTQKFNKWLQMYCDHFGLVLEKKQDNKGRYITIEKVPF